MLTAALVLWVLGLLSFPATQLLRDRIHARRERDGGYGGTGDIAIYSMIATLLLSTVTAVVMYFAILELRDRQKARTASLPHSELRTPPC